MIYLTGDCPPGDLKLICPCCRVLLKAVDVSGPQDKFKTAYLSCQKGNCTHLGINRVRYSWPLPPLFYKEANFWSQTESEGGLGGLTVTRIGAKTEGIAPGNGGPPTTRKMVIDEDLGPMLLPKGETTMGDKTPKLMHQLSAREKMIFSLYAAKRESTPLSIEYSVPVGHEFLEASGVFPATSIPDTDPRLFRIDVIEKYDDHIFLIEVKTHADLKAYGQLMAYRLLYQMHYAPKIPVVPLLVYEDASKITIGVCLTDEIPVFKVSIDTALDQAQETSIGH